MKITFTLVSDTNELFITDIHKIKALGVICQEKGNLTFDHNIVSALCRHFKLKYIKTLEINIVKPNINTSIRILLYQINNVRLKSDTHVDCIDIIGKSISINEITANNILASKCGEITLNNSKANQLTVYSSKSVILTGSTIDTVKTMKSIKYIAISASKISFIEPTDNTTKLNVTLSEINVMNITGVSKTNINQCNVKNCISQYGTKKEYLRIHSSKLVDTNIQSDYKIIELIHTEVDNLNISNYVLYEQEYKNAAPNVSEHKERSTMSLRISDSILKTTNLNTICQLTSLKNNIIDKLLFSSQFNVNHFITSNNTISIINGLSESSFSECNTPSLEWVVKCLENDNRYEDGYDVRYKICVQSKDKTIWNWFLDKTIGYGYKPYRSISFALLTIISFAIFYGFCDLLIFLLNGGNISFDISSILNTLSELGDDLYLSGYTFTTTGYADEKIISSNYLCDLIYFIKNSMKVFESMIGVSLFSLLIFSVTRKHVRS